MARYKSAWIRQLPGQVKKLGKEKASWYVEWREPDGTQRCESCGPGSAGKKRAKRLSEHLRAELLTGTYQKKNDDKKWKDFCDEYSEKILSNLRPRSKSEILTSLRHFTRIIKPKRVSTITVNHIATFISKRRLERGKKPKSKASPATVNKDLRHLRGALRTAAEWGYIEKAPKIKFLREPKKLPRYVIPEDFAVIYQSCDGARLPDDVPYSAAEWWRGLLVMAQMTGWRISELLSVRWVDVDLDAAMAITRHRDNKGGRDAKVPLHEVVVEHLKPLKSFDEFVFPWSPHRRTLDSEFARIQDAAGIHLRCPDAGADDHGECTAACHRYSFHDERRAFATLNAPNMTREALQFLMRHQSPDTTDRYINMARQLNPAISQLHVPDVLTSASTQVG
ncbi:MAG: tyrosine-type recombinase/integrase [Planctomycetes bacterium]|nr:tyrosine-type recombinase/integrase [Planctomycetota bacterium]